MNLTMKSFLFLFKSNVVILFLIGNCCFSQTSNDSLNYYSNLALRPQNADELFAAQSYFDKSYNDAIRNDNTEKIIYHSYFLASISYRMGDYDLAEKYGVHGLELADKLPSSDYISNSKKSLYNILGNIYKEQNNKPKALDLYSRTLKSAISARDSAAVFNNKTIVYLKFNDSIQAKTELLKAYDLIPRIGDSLTVARILDNLGSLIAKEDEIGLDYMRRALNIRELKKDTSTMYTSYMHLSEYYNVVGDSVEAKVYALKALDIANKLKSASYMNNALGLLVNLSSDDYVRSYKRLNDSIQKANGEQENRFALLRYDVTKKENELLKSERTIERIILGTFSLMVLFVMLYFYQRSRHKKEKLQEVYNTESRISKRIHDDVANDVFQVMTKLEHEDKANPMILDDLNALYYKTRDISKEHDIHLGDSEFDSALMELIDNYNDVKTNIIIKDLTKIDWQRIPDLHKITIYKVLQELLINMKKHSEAGIVVLSFSQENGITIAYKDNGKGANISKGTGLQITENRMKAINGTITFESEPGKGFNATLFVK